MDKLIAGQEFEIPGFIIMSEYGNVMHSECEMTNHGYITVMPHTVKFTVPENFNAVAAEVAAIEKKLDSMADDYHKKVRNLKERIESLLCLEMSPSVKSDPEPEDDWNGPF